VVRKRREPEDFLDTFTAVRKRFTAIATEAYAEADIGQLQSKLVRHIGKNTPVSQAALARITDTDPTLLSRTLATLIGRGLVRKSRSEEDKREYVLELTTTGKRLRERLEKLRSQFIEKLVGLLDDGDLDAFDRLAAKILTGTSPGSPRPRR